MQNDPRTHGLWEKTAPAAPVTETLRDSVVADVVVIGGGYTGLSTALHLRGRGITVVVLEAVDVGYGGSGRNVGLVNAGMWVTPSVVTETLGPVFGERLLCVLGAAPQLVFELADKHGIACELERAGTLHCAVGRRGFSQLQQRAAQWIARGAPVRLLDASETARRIGSAEYAGGLLDLRAGTIQPLAYVRGLARAAIEAGSNVFTHSLVSSASRSARGWTACTAEGAVTANWIVVATDAYATGPWHSVRGEQVHLPYFNFATEPLSFRVRDSILPERQGAWDTRAVLSSFRMDAAGRLIFGSVGSLRGAGTSVHEVWAKRAVRKLFPQLGEVAFETGWYGHIGMTDDNLPRFHELAPNVIGFSGYNGRGIAPGTAFGRILADYISGHIRRGDLPLPVTRPRQRTLRRLFKEVLYETGSQLMHSIDARF
jgi:glycine/D-amino acid oxidase-like deaminating enzyme